MLWMIFLALIAVVLVLVVAAMRRLEVDRTAGARLIASGFFLVLAFIGLATATLFGLSELQAPRRFIGDEDLGARVLAVASVFAGGIGLFLLILGAVHVAQSQWRHKLNEDEEIGRLDDLDISKRGNHLDH